MTKRNRITINIGKVAKKPDVSFIHPWYPAKDGRVSQKTLRSLAGKYNDAIYELQRQMVCLQLWHKYLHLLPDVYIEKDNPDLKYSFDSWYMIATYTIAWSWPDAAKWLSIFKDLGWEIHEAPEREPGATELEWIFLHPDIMNDPLYHGDYWYKCKLKLKMYAKDADQFKDDQEHGGSGTHCYKILIEEKEVTKTVIEKTYDVVCAQSMAELSEEVMARKAELGVE
jgi:hypothetical protein